MTDKELLEFAAKGAGWEATKVDERGWFYISHSAEYTEWELWNPLEGDGDCARLESKLRISVVWIENLQEVHAFSVPSGVVVTEKYDDHCGDKGKARRYASTRAAAAIGKAMPSTDGGGV